MSLCAQLTTILALTFVRLHSKGSFTLRWQWHNFHYFGAVATAVMNGFNTYS